MPLALYGHPFSSYTQKVLIALYENALPFEFRSIGPDTPQHVGEWLRRWPLRTSLVCSRQPDPSLPDSLLMSHSRRSRPATKSPGQRPGLLSKHPTF